MSRPHRPACTLAALAIVLGAWGACTQDFDQFAPAPSSQGSGGATTTATSSTTSGGDGGRGGAGGGEPFCGDSIQDPGEECDDGNVLPADGCSATCTIEDPDSCPGPSITLTTAGFTVTGDTTGASRDTGQLPCGGGASGDLVYQITPATSGTMEASLTGSFETLLYARSTCPGANGSNLACSATHGPATLTMPVTAGTPFHLFVDGYGGSTEEGPFTLTLKLD